MKKRLYEGKVIEIEREDEQERYLILRKLQPAAAGYSYEIYKYDFSTETFSSAEGSAKSLFVDTIAPALAIQTPEEPNTHQAGNVVWEEV